jgi:hypothetical protein
VLPAATSNVRKIRVFISYSRKDRDAVACITQKLSALPDAELFRDTEDILPTEEWRKRLEGLIAAADAIVFCMSPDSITSEVCAWELDYASLLNKRIVPLVIREVSGQVPNRLSRLNYIFATDCDIDKMVSQVSTALKVDISWIREHTRIGELAIRWHANGKPTDQLLRGRELDLAQQWAEFRPNGAPELTRTTIEYLENSHAEAIAAAWRARRLRAVFGVLCALLAIGGIGWWHQTWLKE